MTALACVCHSAPKASSLITLYIPSLTSPWIGPLSRVQLEANAGKIHEYMLSLSNALVTASFVGCALGLLFYTAAMLNLILDFRVQVIQARRGIWQFDEPKVAIRTAIVFMGTQISNGVFTFLVTSTIFGALAVVFAWQLTWDVVAYVLTSNAALILTIIGFALINPLLKLAATKVMFTKKSIKWRYGWAAFELWELMTQVAAGLVKSIVRFVLVLLVVFFSLPRLDRSPFPAWVEYYLLLDAGSKSYQGVILTYHLHNNPIMRVACWILQEDARDRRNPDKRAALGLVTPKRRRGCNRWQKALFLLRNPSLQAFVKASAATEQRKQVASLIQKLAAKGKPFDEVEDEVNKLQEKKRRKELDKQTKAEERQKKRAAKQANPVLVMGASDIESAQAADADEPPSKVGQWA